MGSSCAATAGAGPVCEMQADWDKYIGLIRSSVPGWARAHRDFESVANECLADAIRSFDEGRGVSFEAFLRVVARVRMPDRLRREHGRFVAESLDSLRELHPEVEPVFAYESPRDFDRSAASIEAMQVVDSFLRILSDMERPIAAALAAGILPAEVARARGVGRSNISNAVSRMRPKACTFWDLEERTSASSTAA